MSKHAFQQVSEDGGADGFHALLSPDVVLHSPVLDAPLVGRDTVAAVLPRIRGLFDEMIYTADLQAVDGVRALHTRVKMRGLEGENLQLLHFDGEGLITDITIFTRPLPITLAVVEAVGLNAERRDDGTWSVALVPGRSSTTKPVPGGEITSVGRDAG